MPRVAWTANVLRAILIPLAVDLHSATGERAYAVGIRLPSDIPDCVIIDVYEFHGDTVCGYGVLLVTVSPGCRDYLPFPAVERVVCCLCPCWCTAGTWFKGPRLHADAYHYHTFFVAGRRVRRITVLR